MVSSRSFMGSCLIFRSLSHFEFIFVYGERVYFSFIVLRVAVQLSQHRLLKRLSFPIVYSCLFCWRLIDHRCVGLFLVSILFHWRIFLFLCQYMLFYMLLNCGGKYLRILSLVSCAVQRGLDVFHSVCSGLLPLTPASHCTPPPTPLAATGLFSVFLFCRYVMPPASFFAFRVASAILVFYGFIYILGLFWFCEKWHG